MYTIKQYNILGIDINDISIESLIKFIQKRIRNNKNKLIHIITINPEMVVETKKNKKFNNIVKKADLVIPDGVGIVLAGRILKRKKLHRIPGIDITYAILNSLSSSKVFLFGSKLDVVRKINQKEIDRIVGVLPGYGVNNGEVIKTINQSRANILLVGLGSPKQEIWINENISKLHSVKIVIGIGGSLDFLSGKVKRSPNFLRKIGLEWFWRLLCQPWRLKRIYNAVVVFLYLVIKEKLKISK